jgi:hypothetical protein
MLIYADKAIIYCCLASYAIYHKCECEFILNIPIGCLIGTSLIHFVWAFYGKEEPSIYD